MASKWEKVVDKAALLTLGCKLIICGTCRSVSWWDEDLCQLVMDHTACFAQGLDSDSNWSDYLRIRRELKQKIREKRNICRQQLMCVCVRVCVCVCVQSGILGMDSGTAALALSAEMHKLHNKLIQLTV